MASRIVDCKSSCAAGMQAAFHIEQAWLLLNAACEVHELNGKMYRGTLAVAMRSLGEAAAALEVQKAREVCHAGA